MPKAENVSLIIANVCKKYGIEYNSTNPHYIALMEDVQKLSDIYLQLKSTIGILKEIEERHDIPTLHSKFESLIKELDDVDHQIIKLARETKENDV
jgi:uncharacterized protein YlbG (UPF0298 family)